MRLVRIYFTKLDEAAYISHLDLQRVMARALRRSGMPVWYSQGFNPHIYMSFALPLPLLHNSLCEMVDVKTESELADFSEYIAPLSEALPQGIEVTAINEVEQPASEIALADYSFAYECAPELVASAAEQYNNAETAMVTRKTKRTQTQVDLREVLPSLEPKMGESSFIVRLPAGGSMNYNPELLAGFLREACGLGVLPKITRLAVYTAVGDTFR